MVPEILATVKAFPFPEVAVVGHTDTMGNADTNVALGLKRATSVQRLLVTAGLDPAIIEVRSHGEVDQAVKTPEQHPGTAQPAGRDRRKVGRRAEKVSRPASPDSPSRRSFPCCWWRRWPSCGRTAFVRLDHTVYDVMMRAVGTSPPSDRITIVDIDERSLSTDRTVAVAPRSRRGADRALRVGRRRGRRARHDVRGAGPVRAGAGRTTDAMAPTETDKRPRPHARGRPRDSRLRTHVRAERRRAERRACSIRSGSRWWSRLARPAGRRSSRPTDAVCNLPVLADAAGASGLPQRRSGRRRNSAAGAARGAAGRPFLSEPGVCGGVDGHRRTARGAARVDGQRRGAGD